MQELFVETGCSEEDELLDDEENDEDGWPAVQACLEPHDIDSVLNEDMNWLADDREIQRHASDSPCGSPGGISRTPVQINNYPSCIIMKSYFR